MIIAIDGYSVTGKSTLAKLLADKMDYTHLNSGLLFRAISHHLLSKGIKKQDLQDKRKEVEALTHQFAIPVSALEEHMAVLRQPAVSELGAQIAKLEFVRAKVFNILKQFAQQSNLVVDGRDIGTVVFPDADLKFFFIADTQVRARRLGAERNRTDFEALGVEIEARDQEDVSRLVAPLKQAADAFVIDTSHLTIQQTLKILEQHVHEL